MFVAFDDVLLAAVVHVDGANNAVNELAGANHQIGDGLGVNGRGWPDLGQAAFMQGPFRNSDAYVSRREIPRWQERSGVGHERV
jgi:hypothetical protein